MTNNNDLSRRSFLRQAGQASLTGVGVAAPWLANLATIGEAAAFGMGLVMIGSADGDVIEEMITHAADSNHEKIIFLCKHHRLKMNK